jgi:N-acetylglutamate synthase-like GNAT family acetyltransferase
VGDVPSIKHVVDATIHASYAMFPPAYRQHWMEDHHSVAHIVAEASDGCTLVVEWEGKVIGVGTVLQGQIQSVFIHPRYQRRGWGTALIHRLEDHARKAGVKTLRLSALPPSKPFFEGLGYHVVAENRFKDTALQQFAYYVMEKSV